MKLFVAEFLKVWTKRTFLLLLLLMVAANTFLLWMGSRPVAGRPDASSYKTMQQNLRGLSMEEKQQLVQLQYETVEGLCRVDEVYRAGAWGDTSYMEYLRENYAGILEQYEELYQQGGYLLYSDNLYSEYSFLSEIKREMNEAAGYDLFLDDIAAKAEQLAGISIFASEDGGGYDQSNIQATAEAYEGMRDIRIDYAPQRGLMVALGFQFSDIILVFFMLVLASVVVREERDNGLLSLIRSTPAGRGKTAMAKLGVLAASLLIAVVLLYGTALVYCDLTYGLGNLMRSIQSVPALMRSTLRLNVASYLGFFVLAKWAAAFIAGAWVMLMVLRMRHLVTGYAAALALLGVNLLIRNWVPATSHWNVLKYANLISLLNSNELLGGYRNLYWFGKPIPLQLVEAVTAVCLGALFVALFYRVFCRAQLLATPRHSFVLPAVFRRRGGTTVLRQEGHKLFVMNGVLVILVLLLAFQVYQCYVSENYIDASEIYYRRYMKQLEGPYTKEKVEWLREEWQRFEPLRRLEQEQQTEGIGYREYGIAAQPFWALEEEYKVFQKVAERLHYVTDTPGAQVVYETGYRKLFGLFGNANLQDTLSAAGVCALCFSGLFAMEKTTGMMRVVAVTPLGRRTTVWRKLLVSGIAAVCIALLTLVPYYWQVATGYGFSVPLANLRSLPEYMEAFRFMNILVLMLLSAFARIVACFTMAMVMLALSYKIGNTLLVLLTGSLLFCLPALLAVIGVDYAGWLGPYPLFHFGAMFTQPATAVAAILLLFVWLLAGVYCGYYLMENFGKTVQKRN